MNIAGILDDLNSIAGVLGDLGDEIEKARGDLDHYELSHDPQELIYIRKNLFQTQETLKSCVKDLRIIASDPKETPPGVPQVRLRTAGERIAE